MVAVIHYQGAVHVFTSPKTDPEMSNDDGLTLLGQLRDQSYTFSDFLEKVFAAGFNAHHYIVYDYSDGGLVREG